MSTKVLHLDDDCEKLQDLVEMFHDENIELILCPSPDEFRGNLLADINNEIKAVILDVINDAKLDSSDYLVCKEMAEKRHLKIFTYSGQTDVIGNDLFRQQTRDFYEKGSPEDLIRLIEDVKVAVEDKNSLCVKAMYPNLFEHLKMLDNESLLCLVSEFLRSFIFEEDKKLRPAPGRLRELYEALFLYLNKNGLLPDECFSQRDKKLNAQDAIKYLKGESTEFVFKKKSSFGVIDLNGPILPCFMAKQLEEIFHFCNVMNHIQDNASDFYVINNTRLVNSYLLQAYFMELCSILVYGIDYCSVWLREKNDRVRCYNLNVEIKISKIERDIEGRPFIGKCLIESPVDASWKCYKLIRNIDSATKEKYPLYLKKKKSIS